MDVIKENIDIILALRNRRKGEDTEPVYEMIDLVVETSNYAVDRLQEEYIRNLKYIVPFIENMFTVTEDMEWPYQARSICEGKFPIENLPVYLQKIAIQLYYYPEK